MIYLIPAILVVITVIILLCFLALRLTNEHLASLVAIQGNIEMRERRKFDASVR